LKQLGQLDRLCILKISNPESEISKNGRARVWDIRTPRVKDVILRVKGIRTLELAEHNTRLLMHKLPTEEKRHPNKQ
jgi:hypothetical protein